MHPRRAALLSSFGAIAALIVGAALGVFLDYRSEIERDREDAFEQISAISDLKQSQLEGWFFERLGDSKIILNTSILRGIDPGSAHGREVENQFKVILDAYHQYGNIVLLDSAGGTQVSVDPRPTLNEKAPALVTQALEENRHLFSEVYEVAEGDKSHLYQDIFAPLPQSAENGAPPGVLALQLDLQAYLYSALEKWPTESPTSRLFLASTKGDQIWVLRQSKALDATELPSRYPVLKTDDVSLAIQQYHYAKVEGQDARGVPVFAVVRPLSDTGWSLVTQVDQREIYEHVHRRTLYLAFLLAALLVAGISAVRMIWVVRSENQLRVSRALLEEAARAKSEFFSNMSHEIRTPLNAIIGLSHLVMRGPLAEKERDYMSKLSRSAETLLAIINDILDFSKIDAGKMEVEVTPFDLESVCNRVTDIIAIQAHKKGLELVTSISPDVPLQLVGDPLRLGQVLMNLLSNAVKFTERGEVVASVELVAKTENRVTLRISVGDTGIGISEEQRSRLFKAFSQSDGAITRKYGGSGLGLTICKGLIEAMGGSIDFKSTPGKGSTFFFTLTFQVDPDAKTIAESYSPVDVRGLEVMVVDDNPTALATLRATLEEMAFHVSAFDSSEAVIEKIREMNAHGKAPCDVLLLDWKMPEMDGIELARRIRNELAHDRLPLILMVTAYDSDEVRRKSEAVGISAVLTKPVTPSALFNAVLDAVAKNAARRPPEKRAPSDTERRAQPRLLDGVRILLVEDNDINQLVAEAILTNEGATVTTMLHGRLAVEWLTSRGANATDIILMDLQMPEMDGYEATRLIKARPELARLPIIALTAHSSTVEQIRCQQLGMCGYVTKPTDPATLIAAIREAVAKGGA